MAKKCRDCEKCVQRGLTALTKKLANTALIVGTAGTSVVASKAIHSGRRLCPHCGHPLTMHKLVNGHFKD